MKLKCCVLLFILFNWCFANAQVNDSISLKEATRIINVLASDSLKGRANFTIDLQKPAHFIAAQFGKDSLLYYSGLRSYLQPFSL